MLTFILSIALWPLCLFIIGLILLQGGAGDLSSAFGGGGQLDSTLGVGAGRKMSKLTGWLGVSFLVIVTFLAIPSQTDFRSIAGPSSAPAATTEQPQTGAAPVIVGAPGNEGQVTITPLRKGTGAPPTDAAATTGDAAAPEATPAPANEAAPAPADAAPAEPTPAPEAKPADAPKAEMSAPQPKGGKKLTLDN